MIVIAIIGILAAIAIPNFIAYRDKAFPRLRAFRPELIVISAGFDAHADDPLGAMQVTQGGFAAMTAVVRDLAEELGAEFRVR